MNGVLDSPKIKKMEADIKELQGATVEDLRTAQKEVHRLGLVITALARERDEFEAKYLAKKTEDLVLEPGNVEWVVNDGGELGVKIGEQYFFLYKGHSLVYRTRDDIGEDGGDGDRPMKVRAVYKREFGECCHPPPMTEHSIDRGERAENGDYTFGNEQDWKDLPRAKETT
jgi:hypothetical protein